MKIAYRLETYLIAAVPLRFANSMFLNIGNEANAIQTPLFSEIPMLFQSGIMGFPKFWGRQKLIF